MDTSTSRLDEIAGLMERQGLSRVRIEEGEAAIELERGPKPGAFPPQAQGAAMPPAPLPAPCPPSPAPAPVPAEAEPLTDAEGKPLDMSKVVLVEAPMVGVYYAAPSPGADPFVHVGSKVRKGDTLCVIEAMKLMNEVTAEADGEIVDICVADGDLVEYGCCLMKLY
ncbi:MAG: acetyl-CoA carboxylase biotin carboxyl carrier protein [Atopobiaceae bacterium]|jgi:acetyl-CoA carboxylase biotin carboxyl carrier protein|nr:acetyl-CoA carboxylase biotin carboxyl carrier protein [Atopobiaceae bacterium]